jgi:tRNA C32,U32 (ribose-2'-O)-methylase TrmJ
MTMAPTTPRLALGAVRVVLVAPRVAANVGAALRAAANFEAGGVTLVAPRVDLADEAIAVVARGLQAPSELLHVAPTLSAALAGARSSVAFTRRGGGGRPAHASPRALLAADPLFAAGALAGGPAAPPGTAECAAALVFGREETGLLDAELRLCSHACAIPTGVAKPACNLSHAVAIALAAFFEAALDAGAESAESQEAVRLRWLGARAARRAPAAELEALLARAGALLAAAGVGVEETAGGGSGRAHGRRVRPAGRLRALLLRAGATAAEVRALHGVLKQLEARGEPP